MFTTNVPLKQKPQELTSYWSDRKRSEVSTPML